MYYPSLNSCVTYSFSSNNKHERLYGKLYKTFASITFVCKFLTFLKFIKLKHFLIQI